jgi:23S rRNA (guanosine2251-2'-O)-methyltransferase
MAELLHRWHPIREALRARRRQLIRLRIGPKPPRRQEELRALAKEAEVPVVDVDAAALAAGLPPGTRPQGAVLEAGALPELPLEELLPALRQPAPCLAMLDGVEDPQNLGAIARAADAAGIAALVLARRRAAPLSPAVSAASAGAIEHLPVARVPNLARALTQLADAGYWSLGADAERGVSIHAQGEGPWQGPLVVVLGAEGTGIRESLARQVDHWVRIPMRGQVASLNVADAAALLFYERLRRVPAVEEGEASPSSG